MNCYDVDAKKDFIGDFAKFIALTSKQILISTNTWIEWKENLTHKDLPSVKFRNVFLWFVRSLY